MQLWPVVAGLLLGLTLGLLYAWVISPLEYVDTAPASLRSDFKDQYRALIASAYLATGDLARAQSRLALLNDKDAVQALTIQAQQAMSTGDPRGSVYALAMLAEALRNAQTETATSSDLSETQSTQGSTTGGSSTTPEETRTPFPSPTPRPTHTPTATPEAPFRLVSQESVCEPPVTKPLLMIEVENAAGEPVPGVELVVSWNRGEEHFYTGFKPEIGHGYADYEMTPGVLYALRVAGGDPLQNLSAPVCVNEGSGDYPGSLRLLFQQPR